MKNRNKVFGLYRIQSNNKTSMIHHRGDQIEHLKFVLLSISVIVRILIVEDSIIIVVRVKPVDHSVIVIVLVQIQNPVTIIIIILVVRDAVVIIVIILRVNDAIIVRVIVSPPSCGHHQGSSEQEKSEHQHCQALHPVLAAGVSERVPPC